MSQIRASWIEVFELVKRRRYSFIAALVMHLGRKMRRIALQSAVMQEIIDVAAVLDAPRMALPMKRLTDF